VLSCDQPSSVTGDGRFHFATMISGFKGVKYGLQKPAKPGASAAAKKKAPIAAFAHADSDDDEDDINAQLRRQQVHKSKQAKWEQQHKEALEQDASVFDYDGVYDSIQKARTQPKQAEKAERKSRYIGNLLDKAKERQKEQDILYERQLERERKVEDALFGDKDKFVTAAYKKKLEEDQKWLEDEKRKEELESKNDVTKREGLGEFYRNLHRNAAFGGSRYAQVHASTEQNKEEEAIKRGSKGDDAKGAAGSEHAQDAAAIPGDEPERSHANETRSPSYPRATQDAEGGSEKGAQRHEQRSVASAPSTTEAKEEVEGPAAAPTGGTALQAGKRRNKEEEVAAARARYLARKKAKTSVS